MTFFYLLLVVLILQSFVAGSRVIAHLLTLLLRFGVLSGALFKCRSKRRRWRHEEGLLQPHLKEPPISERAESAGTRIKLGWRNFLPMLLYSSSSGSSAATRGEPLFSVQHGQSNTHETPPSSSSQTSSDNSALEISLEGLQISSFSFSLFPRIKNIDNTKSSRGLLGITFRKLRIFTLLSTTDLNARASIEIEAIHLVLFSASILSTMPAVLLRAFSSFCKNFAAKLPHRKKSVKTNVNMGAGTEGGLTTLDSICAIALVVPEFEAVGFLSSIRLSWTSDVSELNDKGIVSSDPRRKTVKRREEVFESEIKSSMKVFHRIDKLAFQVWSTSDTVCNNSSTNAVSASALSVPVRFIGMRTVTHFGGNEETSLSDDSRDVGMTKVSLMKIPVVSMLLQLVPSVHKFKERAPSSKYSSPHLMRSFSKQGPLLFSQEGQATLCAWTVHVALNSKARQTSDVHANDMLEIVSGTHQLTCLATMLNSLGPIARNLSAGLSKKKVGTEMKNKKKKRKEPMPLKCLLVNFGVRVLVNDNIEHSLKSKVIKFSSVAGGNRPSVEIGGAGIMQIDTALSSNTGEWCDKTIIRKVRFLAKDVSVRHSYGLNKNDDAFQVSNDEGAGTESDLVTLSQITIDSAQTKKDLSSLIESNNYGSTAVENAGSISNSNLVLDVNLGDCNVKMNPAHIENLKHMIFGMLSTLPLSSHESRKTADTKKPIHSTKKFPFTQINLLVKSTGVCVSMHSLVNDYEAENKIGDSFHAVTCENGESCCLERSSLLIYRANIYSLVATITPQSLVSTDETISEQPGLETKVVVTAPHADASLTFSPFEKPPIDVEYFTAPGIVKNSGEITLNSGLEFHDRIENRIKIETVGSTLKFDIVIPTLRSPCQQSADQGARFLTEQNQGIPFGPRMCAIFESVVVKEYTTKNNSTGAGDTKESTMFSSKGDNTMSLRSTKYGELDSTSSRGGVSAKPTITIIHEVDIQTCGPLLQATWSPVFQWFVMSALKKTNDVIRYHRVSMAPKGEDRGASIDTKPFTKRELTNVHVQSNDTLVCLRSILAGGSIVDIATRNVAIDVTHVLGFCWKKPNVDVSIGLTTFHLNESEIEVVKFDSMIVRTNVRIATTDELIEYCAKLKDPACKNTFVNDLVTDAMLRPLLETIEVKIGQSISLELPPNLHLGEVFDDVSVTPKAMQLGLQAAGLMKNQNLSDRKKFQLMTISVTLPSADAIFLEDESDDFIKSYPKSNKHSEASKKVKKPYSTIKFGVNRKRCEYLDRWKTHFEGVVVTVKRNAPPAMVQSTLNELDEDKSRTHCYTTVIQGGEVAIEIHHMVSILHPLTIATPLLVLNKCQLKGTLLLAGLSPHTEGLTKGRDVRVRVCCHHDLCLPELERSVNDAPAAHDNVKSANIEQTCRCRYGVQYHLLGIPPKVYMDLRISLEEANATHGMVLIRSIPKALEIIKRVTPPPLPPQPSEDKQPPPPPLGWWDNLRFMIHGKMCMSINTLSLRFLMDTAILYERSILVTATNSLIEHSAGEASVNTDDFIVSVPGSSYHVLMSNKKEKGGDDFERFADDSRSEQHQNRHSLLLVPQLKISVEFIWEVLYPDYTKSSEHHCPYLVCSRSVADGQLLDSPDVADKFKRFRSHGTNLILNVSLCPSTQFATWCALRIDVLPWLTHKNPTIETRKSVESSSDAPDPLPKVKRLEIKAYVSNLQIGAWFDESDDFLTDVTSDAVQNGVCLSLSTLEFSLDKTGSREIDADGPIRAALLEINQDPFGSRLAAYPRSSYGKKTSKTECHDRCVGLFGSTNIDSIETIVEETASCDSPRTHSFPVTGTDNKNSYRSFELLQFWSQQITELDYLLVADRVNILDSALDDIGHVSNLDASNKCLKTFNSFDLPLGCNAALKPILERKTRSRSSGGNSMTSSDRLLFQDDTWTVLISGMKLLWTLAIRDSIKAIVHDLLFTINFMKVTARGTSQINMERGNETGSYASLEENYTNRAAPTSISNEAGSSTNRQDENECEGAAFETSLGAGNDVVLLQIREGQGITNTTPSEYKSSLNYLLKSSKKVKDANSSCHRPASPAGFDEVSEIAKRSTVLYNHEDDASSCAGKSSYRQSHSKESDGNQFYRDLLMAKTSSHKDSFEGQEGNGETIPTFDVHLANPQIQLHSESTGGSVILAIHGAYVEGRKFVNLFVKDSNVLDEDISAESLLRRTEFQYTLSGMEIYAVSTDVDVSTGLQWLGVKSPQNCYPRSKNFLQSNVRQPDESIQSLQSADTVEFSTEARSQASKRFFPSHLRHHETQDFIVPGLFKKIMNRCTFQTRQECHQPPIELTKKELDECIYKGSIHLVGIDDSDKALDRVEMLVDELSFLLDSHQFATTIDLIRNVLLEPPKPLRQRHYQSMIEGEHKMENEIKEATAEGMEVFSSGPGTKSCYSCSNMINALCQWQNSATRHQRGKRGRDLLRVAAQDLLLDLEEHQLLSPEPKIRRVEYTLSKLKWKIMSPAFVDDVEINFTGLRGVHDFSAEGSVLSQIALEDMKVVSLKPGPASINFFDPTTILSTVIGIERSPCQRCGYPFDRARNESDACVFHTGSYQNVSSISDIRKWSCCHALSEAAPGCISRPHTGMERAVMLRLDALPRAVDGVTMYKHVEANIYPNVPHTLVVQMTKSLANLFVAYFLGNNTDSGQDVGAKSGSFSPLKEQDTVSSVSDTSTSTNEVLRQRNLSRGLSSSSLSSHPHVGSTGRSNVSGGGKTNKKSALFGKSHAEAGADGMGSLSSGEDESERKPKESSVIKGLELQDKPPDRNRQEILFLKYWRVGNINVNVSLAGFRMIGDASNLSIIVPAFQKAYKIGTADYLNRKLLSHIIHEVVLSLASSGFDKIVEKLTGQKQTINQSTTSSHSLSNPRSAENIDNAAEPSTNTDRAKLLGTPFNGNSSPRKAKNSKLKGIFTHSKRKS